VKKPSKTAAELEASIKGSSARSPEPQHLGLGAQARHFVIDDRYADRVVAAGNVTVKHAGSPPVGLNFPSFTLPCGGEEVVGVSG
jgi:hypothetical protein